MSSHIDIVGIGCIDVSIDGIDVNITGDDIGDKCIDDDAHDDVMECNDGDGDGVDDKIRGKMGGGIVLDMMNNKGMSKRKRESKSMTEIDNHIENVCRLHRCLKSRRRLFFLSFLCAFPRGSDMQHVHPIKMHDNLHTSCRKTHATKQQTQTQTEHDMQLGSFGFRWDQ